MKINLVVNVSVKINLALCLYAIAKIIEALM